MKNITVKPIFLNKVYGITTSMESAVANGPARFARIESNMGDVSGRSWLEGFESQEEESNGWLRTVLRMDLFDFTSYEWENLCLRSEYNFPDSSFISKDWKTYCGVFLFRDAVGWIEDPKTNKLEGDLVKSNQDEECPEYDFTWRLAWLREQESSHDKLNIFKRFEEDFNYFTKTLKIKSHKLQ